MGEAAGARSAGRGASERLVCQHPMAHSPAALLPPTGTHPRSLANSPMTPVGASTWVEWGKRGGFFGAKQPLHKVTLHGLPCDAG